MPDTRPIHELKRRQAELFALQSAERVLDWDQLTHMPKRGGEARGRHRAVLSRLAHERATDPALGKLLAGLSGQGGLSDADADLVRVSVRDFEKAVRVPEKFVSDFAEHSAQSYEAWAKAREADDFAIARPFLEKTVEKSREYAGFFPEAKHVADPLIDHSDPDMTVARLSPLFAELRTLLVPLVERLASRPADDTCLQGVFAADRQVAFSREVAARFGFDFERGRLDESLHPFTTRFHGDDVRITTRVKDDDISDCLFSTLHEAGHGMYDQGIDRAFCGTALAEGASSGIHESQSRLWENQVGRSRPFWEYLYPRLQAEFPQPFKNLPLDGFYRAINRVAPSLIRTDADEVTYNLHIMLRFDLECDLLTGALQVKDLPEAWNERMRNDLGVTPDRPGQGVLQDIHWYVDYVGGAFQGYTIGNLAAAQLFGKAVADHPEVMDEMGSGCFDTLKEWLTRNIWRHGRRRAPDRLIQDATGESLSSAPFLAYLEEKYGA